MFHWEATRKRERRPDSELCIETVVPLYSNRVFHSHFRVTKSSVEKLREYVLRSDIYLPRQTGGIPPIDLTKQILVYLWFAASKEPFRSIADRFNITESSVHRVVGRVTDALNEQLDNIKWPTVLYQKRVVEGFEHFCDIKGVVGAIDGTHILIKGPRKYIENYINRKGFASLVLQCVCDHEMFFTDCYTGWPGSVHDSRVFTNSTLYEKIIDDPFAMFPN